MPAFEPSGTPKRATLQARSISRSVREALDDTSFPGQVIAVYDRACALEFPGGNLFSLVLPVIGDGPLNVVLEDLRRALAAVNPAQEVRVLDQWLDLGDLKISLAGATTWEPSPQWEYLRGRRKAIAGHLHHLEAYAVGRANASSLFRLVLADSGRGRPVSALSCPTGSFHSTRGPAAVDEALHSVAFEAALRLRTGWESDAALLQVGAQQLAGLGCGLTPAGDDFLCGVMLWTWLAHPDPQPCCEAMLKATTSRTTKFSAALLRAAAAGQCSAPWHHLFAILERGEMQHLGAAVEGVLSYGHTSGADALAGFLWMSVGLPKSLAM